MTVNGSYGRELPLRAAQLFRGLECTATQIYGEKPSSGSLHPTFVLTMAIPIIIQLYERFFATKKHQNRLFDDFDGYTEGSRLAKGLAELRGKSLLAETPLGGVDWRFAFLKEKYKLSDGVPDELKSHLSKIESAMYAGKMSLADILSHLRNAMAHGSILYLNEDRQPSLFQDVEYFLFVNAPNARTSQFLLIRVADFRDVILQWADWLHSHEYEPHVDMPL